MANAVTAVLEPAAGEDLARAVAALPPVAQALLAAPQVRVVGWDDPAVPDDIRAQARLQRRGRRPSVCHHDDEAGTFLLVIGEPDDLGHELIHVAQALADGESLATSLAEVARDGHRLVEAARRAVREGRDPTEHRDLTWCKNAAHPRNDTPPKPGCQDSGMIATFDLHRMVHPVAATRELGAELGLDADATSAASFAYYLAVNGTNRPGSDPARECVAYRYQRDLTAVAPLFESALARLTPCHA